MKVLILSLLVVSSLQMSIKIQRYLRPNKHEKYHNYPLIDQQLIELQTSQGSCQRDINNFVYEPKSNFYVVEKQDYEYSDMWDKFQINWGNADVYKKSPDYLGGGTFSKVYLGTVIDTNQTVVLKYFNDEKWDYVAKIEAKIEKTLVGGPNIQQLMGAFKTSDHQLPFCLVYDFICKTTMSDFVNNNPPLPQDEVKTYMYQLLTALEFSHSKGIVHLDLKPDNIIIDQTNKQIQVIDWGIAEFIVSDKEQVRRGTYEFSAPEALIEYRCCDFTLDSWSAGTLMGVMLFNRGVLFDQSHGQRNTGEIFANQANFYPEEEVNRVLSRLNIDMSKRSLFKQSEFKKYRDTASTQTYESEFINDSNKDRISDDAIDLMKQLLTFDYTQRISPGQALTHRYFDSIRNPPDSPTQSNASVPQPTDSSTQSNAQVTDNAVVTPPTLLE